MKQPPVIQSKASLDQIPQVVALATEFYAERGHALNHAHAASAFAAMLADDRLCHVRLIKKNAEA